MLSVDWVHDRNISEGEISFADRLDGTVGGVESKTMVIVAGFEEFERFCAASYEMTL
jgi:hypothetical protein